MINKKQLLNFTDFLIKNDKKILIIKESDDFFRLFTFTTFESEINPTAVSDMSYRAVVKELSEANLLSCLNSANNIDFLIENLPKRSIRLSANHKWEIIR